VTEKEFKENSKMDIKTKTILKMERLRKNLRQEDVAKYLSLAKSSYAKYETGENTPTTDSLLKLSDLYEVSVDYLLGKNVNLSKFLQKSYEDGKTIGTDIADGVIERKRASKRAKKET